MEISPFLLSLGSGGGGTGRERRCVDGPSKSKRKYSKAKLGREKRSLHRGRSGPKEGSSGV